MHFPCRGKEIESCTPSSSFFSLIPPSPSSFKIKVRKAHLNRHHHQRDQIFWHSEEAQWWDSSPSSRVVDVVSRPGDRSEEKDGRGCHERIIKTRKWLSGMGDLKVDATVVVELNTNWIHKLVAAWESEWVFPLIASFTVVTREGHEERRWDEE